MWILAGTFEDGVVRVLALYYQDGECLIPADEVSEHVDAWWQKENGSTPWAVVKRDRA